MYDRLNSRIAWIQYPGHSPVMVVIKLACKNYCTILFLIAFSPSTKFWKYTLFNWNALYDTTFFCKDFLLLASTSNAFNDIILKYIYLDISALVYLSVLRTSTAYCHTRWREAKSTCCLQDKTDASDLVPVHLSPIRTILHPSNGCCRPPTTSSQRVYDLAGNEKGRPQKDNLGQE